MVCEGKWRQLMTLKVTGLRRPHPVSLTHEWLEGTGGGWGDHQESARARKGHSTYFHQYKPSKQCETGPSIAPYWDHNIILPSVG